MNVFGSRLRNRGKGQRLARLAVGALVALVSLVACSDDATAPSGGDELSLDEILTELHTVGTYAGAGLGPLGLTANSGSGPAAPSCSYDPASSFFVCPQVQHDGLTFNRRYQVLDGTGAPLPSFDPALASGIREIVDMSGTIERQNPVPATTTIASHQEQTMTGIGTSSRTVNGMGAMLYTMTSGGQTFESSSTRTIANLVLPSTSSGTRAYPSSGSITNTVETNGVTMTSTMTFNGTSTVTIVTTFNGTTQTCTYDLETPHTAPVCLESP